MVGIAKLMTDRRVWILAGAFVLLVGLSLGLAQWAEIGLSDLSAYFDSLRGYLSARPWLLFISLVILPGFPFPVSALLFTAGLVWKDQPVFACGMCMLALAINFVWTYWVAAGPGKRLISKLLASMSVKVPEGSSNNPLRLILLMRLTPGIPLFFQNYMLGIFGVPFRLYLLLSLLCNGILSIGVILVGAGLAEGGLVSALTGVACVVVGLLLAQTLRSWLARRRIPSD